MEEMKDERQLWIILFITSLGSFLTPFGVEFLQGFSGTPLRDSLAIGFGMSPRGEVAMIVALMGLNLSLIGQDIYASIVVMSILTTVITPIAFRNWLFKKEVKACIAGEQGMQ